MEHWFKNVKKRQFSQYAHDFVTAYLAQMAENEPKREGKMPYLEARFSI